MKPKPLRRSNLAGKVFRGDTSDSPGEPFDRNIYHQFINAAVNIAYQKDWIGYRESHALENVERVEIDEQYGFTTANIYPSYGEGFQIVIRKRNDRATQSIGSITS